jgi:ABC-2 type transport system ATP-binding protein
MIETSERLSMRYGAVRALNGIRFRIGEGEIVGLLGPNGAGKSSTLKIATSYIYPTEGTVYVAGKDVRHECSETRRMIGYLPEQLPLYMDMEVAEYLRFVGEARGLAGSRLRERLAWVEDRCGLGPVFRKLIRELSKGYRQRTALAQALIHDPRIVILDEPTSGLDPHQILEIRRLVLELGGQGKTVLFSSHILQEVEAVARRIVILNRGEIIADGSPEELRSRAAERMTCDLVLPSAPEAEVRAALEALPEIERVEKAREFSWTVEGRAGCDVRPALAALVRAKGWDFLEFARRLPSLEEVFLKLTKPETAQGERL